MYYVFCITRWVALLSMPLLALSSYAKSDWGWLLAATLIFAAWLPRVPRF